MMVVDECLWSRIQEPAEKSAVLSFKCKDFLQLIIIRIYLDESERL